MIRDFNYIKYYNNYIENIYTKYIIYIIIMFKIIIFYNDNNIKFSD